jgi:hypothetical protein
MNFRFTCAEHFQGHAMVWARKKLSTELHGSMISTLGESQFSLREAAGELKVISCFHRYLILSFSFSKHDFSSVLLLTSCFVDPRGFQM